jgi:hypothetical protein
VIGDDEVAETKFARSGNGRRDQAYTVFEAHLSVFQFATLSSNGIELAHEPKRQ